MNYVFSGRHADTLPGTNQTPGPSLAPSAISGRGFANTHLTLKRVGMMRKSIVLLTALCTTLTWCGPSSAHEHKAGESTEAARIVEFYSTWKRPKGDFSVIHRQPTCCYGSGSQQDCFPVLAVRKNEQGITEVMPDVTDAATEAQARYGSRWYPLNHNIEEDKQPDARESPDGRSHVCVAPSGDAICYVAGYGN